MLITAPTATAMSTPSTATAPLPPHYHGHSYHPAYSNSTQHSQSDMSLNGAARLPQNYHNFPSPSTRTSTSARPNSAMNNHTNPAIAKAPAPSKVSKKKQPDWNEFYKNGVPQEIIVIDDDSPPPAGKASKAEPLHPPSVNNMPAEHAVKKRRTGLNHEAAIGRPHPSYSGTNTPQYPGSTGTISTDRNTSMNTTAPTSLGSGSGGSVGYGEASGVGQKRKRTTRQDAAAEKKRKEDVVQDPYSNYVPPPRPAKKAKDVPVPVVRETPIPHQRIDDDDGHYIINENTPLTNKYHILRLLGQGTFGKVVEAVDRMTGTRCAIKIIRSVQKYRDASKIELRVLSTLAMNDKENRNKCIHFRECFDFRSHICIVTDLLGQSVFDFLKANAFVPFPSSQIQSFARQLLTSVAFLHDLNLIHTDLKPENILLVSNAYQTFTYNKTIPSSSQQTQRTARQRRVLLDTDIRLIDFGSATFDEEYHSSVVSTRHYRAPEIILSLGWSFPCDIWSIGCILVEFFTGDALFQTHDNLEHLAMMEMVVKNRIDPKLVRTVLHKGGQPSKFFKKDYRLDYPTKETTKASRNYVRAMKSLDEIIPSNNNFNRQFLDLLKRIFVYDPARRITAKEALRHPWFREGLVDDGTEAARIKREREAAQAASRQQQQQQQQVLAHPSPYNR